MRYAMIMGLAGLVAGGAGFASASETAGGVAQVISQEDQWGRLDDGLRDLLVTCEAASAARAGMTADERRALGEQVAAVAATCPVASRLGDSLSAVNDALKFIVATGDAAEHCPLLGADSGEIEAAKELKVQRARVLADVSRLAAFASGAMLSTDEIAPTGGHRGTEVPCPIRTACRIGLAKASLVDARREAELLSPEAREEIVRGFGFVSRQDPAIAQLPESIVRLSEGLERLSVQHRKMIEMVRENPDLMARIPPSARRAARIEVSLVDEARSLMRQVTESMAVVNEPSTASNLD